MRSMVDEVSGLLELSTDLKLRLVLKLGMKQDARSYEEAIIIKRTVLGTAGSPDAAFVDAAFS